MTGSLDAGLAGAAGAAGFAGAPAVATGLPKAGDKELFGVPAGRGAALCPG